MVKRKGKGKAKWNDKKRGRPKSYITSKLIEVYELLPEDHSKISTSELKKRVASKGMGYDTLYKYLKILMTSSQIIREYGEEGYPPQVYYRRAPSPDFKTQDLFFTEKHLALQYSLLSIIGDEKLDEELIGLRGKIKEELRKTFEGELNALNYLYTQTIKQAGEIYTPTIKQAGEIKLDEKAFDKRRRHIEVVTKIHLRYWFDHLTELACNAGDLITPDRGKVEKYFTDENLERKKSLEKKVMSNKTLKEMVTPTAEDVDLEELAELWDLEDLEELADVEESEGYQEIIEKVISLKKGKM